MSPSSRPRSPLWLVVLALVSEEPMHPYRMQMLIRERGKDEIANVAQRNSVYQTIAALLRAGLIEVRETLRSERRPERTIYGITQLGRRTLQSWMRALLSTPAREFPDFPAALSLVMGIPPDKVRALLETRVELLEKRLAKLETPVPGLPRLFLLEMEYLAALVRAEIDWVRAVIGDLRSGRLTWNDEWLRQIAVAWSSQNGGATSTATQPGSAANRQELSPPSKRRRAEGAVSRAVGRRRTAGRRRT